MPRKRKKKKKKKKKKERKNHRDKFTLPYQFPCTGSTSVRPSVFVTSQYSCTSTTCQVAKLFLLSIECLK
jgi:hypothetical protein